MIGKVQSISEFKKTVFRGEWLDFQNVFLYNHAMPFLISLKLKVRSQAKLDLLDTYI